MPKPLSFGSIAVGLTTGAVGDTSRPQADVPFRIALLGDWAGRDSRGQPPASGRLANRRPVPVDRDDFDLVLAGLGVELYVPVAPGVADCIPLRFTELEDFHPDRLLQRVEIFQALRALRQRLSNASTFATAAAEMRGWAGTSPPPEPAPAAPPPPNSETLLQQILAEPAARPSEAASLPGGIPWGAFLQRIVAPHVAAQDDPRQAELVARMDEALAAQLRAVLHDPGFQALEAAWRAAFFLVRHLDTGANLRLYLIDVSRAELAADLLATEDLHLTGIYRLLVEQTVGTPGAPPWAIVAGAYTFDQTEEDVQILGRMARIAGQAGAPFLAAAHERILGCAILAATPDPADWHPEADAAGNERWQGLRRLPEAAYLGLALPRFLLRLPYGPDTSPVEQLDFAEMPAAPVHEEYLWGNPAFAGAALLAEGFSRHGWDAPPGLFTDLEGLPVHTYEGDGESRAKPCAEVVLTERASTRIQDKGLMPLLSLPNRDGVRLASFQALAEPRQRLAGRWSSSS
jgi:type VI secretion system protein ImpC